VTREQPPPQPKTPLPKPCPSIAGLAPVRIRNRANKVVVEPRSAPGGLLSVQRTAREHINTAHAAATLAIPANVSRDTSPANAHA
jgi:hypothetical protein